MIAIEVGSLVYDDDLGRSALVLEVMTGKGHTIDQMYYRVMYDDGQLEVVFDYEVEPIESR